MSKIVDGLNYKTHWTIRKFQGDREIYDAWVENPEDPSVQPFEISEIEGNLLLNEGIAELWDIIIAAGGTTDFDNTNARIGVGDDATAAAATQTDLQAAVNKTYKAMEATYPSRASQTVTFRSVFGSSDANYDWNEFVVDNGGTALKTLNRKVSAEGTKASGQTWTVDVAITLS